MGKLHKPLPMLPFTIRKHYGVATFTVNTEPRTQADAETDGIKVPSPF